MRLGTEIRATIWSLLALQLVTSAGAIVLFSRMAPAINRILAENVVSLGAVQEMQQALASPGGAPDQRFQRALARAEHNVTEAEERPVLRRLREIHPQALSGAIAARGEVLRGLERLTAINLAAMQRSDRRASRLGEAGGWAMATLGLLCFAISLWAVRRMVLHVTRPLTRIHQTVAAFRGGDSRRRCAIRDAALEITDIAQAVDHLLDTTGGPRAGERAAVPEQARAALLALLDAEDRPTLVIARSGEVVAASQTALEALGQDPALRERLLAQLVEPDAASDAHAAPAETRALGHDLWLARLTDPSSST